MSKKILILSLLSLANILILIICIYIYSRISKNPILFFASVFLILIFAGLNYFLMKKYFQNEFDPFTALVNTTCIALVCLVFSVFSHVFIDRSISYHIAFYASQNKSIAFKEFQAKTATFMYQKREKDAVSAGFISKNTDGTYSPTLRATIFTKLMIFYGNLTNSLGDYNLLKDQMK